MRATAALAFLFAFGGCGLPTQKDLAQQAAANPEYTRQVENLEIRPPAGKVTMRRVAGIFAKGCLPAFPEVEVTLSNLKKAGLTTEEKLGWDAGENGLRSNAIGVSASVGLARKGELEFTNTCNVQGEVSDPQSDPIAALHVFAPDLKFDNQGSALVTRGLATYRVTVGAPHLSEVTPALTSIGVLSNLNLARPEYWKGAYRYWSYVYFEAEQIGE